MQRFISQRVRLGTTFSHGTGAAKCLSKGFLAFRTRTTRSVSQRWHWQISSRPRSEANPVKSIAKQADLPALIQAVRARTPARILVGRSGPSYRTATQLELRQDHAAALDAVHADLDIATDFERSF